jgi:hypothetical protein
MNARKKAKRKKLVERYKLLQNRVVKLHKEIEDIEKELQNENLSSEEIKLKDTLLNSIQ